MSSAEIWIVGAIGLSILRLWTVKEGYRGESRGGIDGDEVVELRGANVRARGFISCSGWNLDAFVLTEHNGLQRRRRLE